jgi:3-oxoadipate enol-lactonase
MPMVTVDGINIAYSDTAADLPAVVMVHGFPLNSSLWDAQKDALSDRFRVVTLDLMGFGASDAPEVASAYSMAAFAHQVRAVIAAVGLGRVAICGLSMGGYVCFELWRRHRDVISALVLADTKAEADDHEAKDRRTAQQEQVRARGARAVAEEMTDGLLSQSTRSKKPDVVTRAMAVMENPAAGYVGALEAMKARVDSTDDLVTIDVPTLVVVGEEDTITPPVLARKLHEHIGGSRLVVIPEAGHLSNLEAPEIFTGAVAEFLASG